MSNFTMLFSGTIKTVKAFSTGKPAIRFSICKKNYNKDAAAEQHFTWVNFVVFEPKPWTAEMLKEGKFVSGFGKFEMRGYGEGAEKKTTAEVVVSGFDLDGPKAEEGTPYRAAPAAAPARPAATPPAGGGHGDDEPPFAPYIGAGICG